MRHTSAASVAEQFSMPKTERMLARLAVVLGCGAAIAGYALDWTGMFSMGIIFVLIGGLSQS